jgi:carbonic anhydrase
MLNGNGALDTSTHRLFERVREGHAEPPTEELAALGAPQGPPDPEAPVNDPASAVRLHERAAGGAANPMTTTQNATTRLLVNAERYAADFGRGDLPSPPASKVAVLACMDARLNPYGLLGLKEGDAHVIRNAGGVVSDDALRSLAVSQNLLGTEEIMLIHHTDCGMLTFTDDEFADRPEGDTGERPTWRAHGFADVERDVREGIERIRASAFVPRKDAIRGFVYEVETGRLREVAPS